MADAGGRLRAVDWLRGIAVLFMLQTHTLSLLKPVHHAELFFKKLERFDGLVAPTFIFCAGFSLALVQVRGARKGSRSAQAKKTLKRLAEVLGVATLLNLIWFPWWFEPWFLWRLDILHTIGLSLLLALPLMVALAPRPQVLRWVMLLLALAIFFASPVLEHVGGPFSFVFNGDPYFDETTGSLFPLVPWAGWGFLGASLGATAGLGGERRLWAWCALLLALGAAAWLGRGWLKGAYGEHDFWTTNPSDTGERLVKVLAGLLVLRFVELKWPAVEKTRLMHVLTVFGTSSLSAYFFHLLIIYNRVGWVFGLALYWKQSADWPDYAVMVALLVWLTWRVVTAFDGWWPGFKQRAFARPPAPALSPAP